MLSKGPTTALSLPRKIAPISVKYRSNHRAIEVTHFLIRKKDVPSW